MQSLDPSLTSVDENNIYQTCVIMIPVIVVNMSHQLYMMDYSKSRLDLCGLVFFLKDPHQQHDELFVSDGLLKM